MLLNYTGNAQEQSSIALASFCTPTRKHRPNGKLCVQESFFNKGAVSEEWIAPERRVRHVNVPAVRASHMPWLAPEPSTPASARRVRAPAGGASHMPWLPSEPSTPTAVSLSSSLAAGPVVFRPPTICRCACIQELAGHQVLCVPHCSP